MAEPMSAFEVFGTIDLKGGNQVLDQFKKITTQAKDGAAPAMAAVGVAASAMAVGINAALAHATGTAQNFGNQVILVQRLTGASAAESSKFAAILGRSGIEGSKVGLVMKTLGNNIMTNSDAMKMAGISSTNANGTYRSQIDVLGDLAEWYSTATNKTEANAVATKMLGRGLVQLLPILSSGRKGIEDLSAAAERNGLVLTQDNIDAVKKYGKAQKDLADTMKGTEVQVGLMTMPFETFKQKVLGDMATELNRTSPELKQLAVGAAYTAEAIGAIGGPALIAAAGIKILGGAAAFTGIAYGVLATAFSVMNAATAQVQFSSIQSATEGLSRSLGMESGLAKQISTVYAWSVQMGNPMMLLGKTFWDMGQQAVNALTGAVNAAPPATAEMVELGDAMGGAAFQARDLKAAQEELHSDTDTLAQAQLDYVNAQKARWDAEDKVAALEKAGKQGTFEYTQAVAEKAVAVNKETDAKRTLEAATTRNTAAQTNANAVPVADKTAAIGVNTAAFDRHHTSLGQNLTRMGGFNATGINDKSAQVAPTTRAFDVNFTAIGQNLTRLTGWNLFPVSNKGVPSATTRSWASAAGLIQKAIEWISKWNLLGVVSKSLGLGGLTIPASRGDANVMAGRAFARAQLGEPYVLGAAGPDAWDCSGYVSGVLHAMGWTGERFTTGEMHGLFAPGPGQQVTLGYLPPSHSGGYGHTGINIMGEWYESSSSKGGVTGPPNSRTSWAELFHIPGFSRGGLMFDTGLAMLHGTQTKPERVLNADETAAYEAGRAGGNTIINIPPTADGVEAGKQVIAALDARAEIGRINLAIAGGPSL